MDARAVELERHKLSVESSEHAYSNDTVVHTMQKSGLSEVSARWKRVKEVGSGAFGTIWLEEDEIGELRAVKCLPRRMFRVDFLREVHALAELRGHPDEFVHFLGWFEDRDFIFIAMEYTECGDLRKYLKDSRPKARREVREITGQILEGLVVLHGKNICHRDLNPQNILIASFSPIRVKIADFGVSKREIDTQLRTFCGTPGYRAPEQQGILPREFMSGSGRSYTNAADLWALGCLVHEILTSEIPFLCPESDSGAVVSGLGSLVSSLGLEGTERVPDTMLLVRYCEGSIEFPMKSLDNSLIGKEGIDFVKRLLVPNPRLRISASDALASPWLLETNDSETLRNQFSCSGAEISLEAADYLIAHWPVDLTYLTQALPNSTKDVLRIWHAGASNGYLLTKSLLAVINGIDFRVDGLTALQSAASCGILDTVKFLLEHFKPAYVPPGVLWAAAAGGSFNVVNLLLERGTDPNARTHLDCGAGSQSHSALQVAVENGHYSVVQLLLYWKANANFIPTNDRDRTVLWAAAAGGHLSMINLLLDSGADVNSRPRFLHEGYTSYGQTALQVAAARGHLNIVQLLLYRGADANAEPSRSNGRTALQAAAGSGHIGAVKLLLDTRAEVNAEPSTYGGRTALQAAAEGGHSDVVKLLLDNGADVNAEPSRSRGRTTLQAAVGGGHIDAVKLLLDTGADVNAEPCYSDGRTALQAAAGGGHIDVVKLLLDTGADVNAKPCCSDGRTALQAAAEGGHTDVVKLLLDTRAEVNAKPCTYGGRTALQAAAEGGHFDVVMLLLDTGADVNAKPCYSDGRTALQAAAGGGHTDVVKLLLDTRAEANAKPFTHGGRTALQAAAEGGHFDVVELLLDSGADANAEPYFSDGRRALQAAAGGGHIDVVRLLLDTGADVNAEPCCSDGRTALQAAAGGGHIDVVRLLFDNRAEVNAELCTHGGRTALQAAAEGGHVDVVKLLLDTGADVNAEPCFSDGRTALQAAAGGGHIDVVRLLLDTGANVNAEPCCSGGRTALRAAVGFGHFDVVKLLLDNGVDINARHEGWTALHEATHSRHEDVVELLLDATMLRLANGPGHLSVATPPPGYGVEFGWEASLGRGSDAGIQNNMLA